MHISFHGAARTVTGSKHLIHLNNGTKILLDCGMFQGLGRETLGLNQDWGFEPSEVDVVVLSHAHIDHVGLMPKLVKDGFIGKIWCTSATADLARILMLDSARIQEGDIRFINRKRERDGRPLVDALYTEEDAIATTHLFAYAEYDEETEIAPGVQLLFTDAGHLLGSAAVHLTINEEGEETRISFSGDIGRYRDAILRSPQVFPQADYVIMECTYGDTLHELASPAGNALEKWIRHTCLEKGGKLIIPAFSVGRTQEILYQLNRLELERRLPDVKYYVDSPLSINATEVIKRHPECYNEQVEQVMRHDPDVFLFKGLEYIETADESIALNGKQEPCVIISSSGMAEAGRVKHHIAHNISSDKNTILLAGYCEPRSLGGQLKSGAKQVSIFGKEFNVVAEVGAISSMSAHGDHDDLCRWLSCQDPKLVRKVFLVHGEYEVQQAFAKRLENKSYWPVEIPEQHALFALRS
jgi:metallo-beta-lactamase family protein